MKVGTAQRLNESAAMPINQVELADGVRAITSADTCVHTIATVASIRRLSMAGSRYSLGASDNVILPFTNT
jgi:hypothetical protein